jgi:hypothetical protein
MTQPFMIYGVGNPTRLLEEEIEKGTNSQFCN